MIDARVELSAVLRAFDRLKRVDSRKVFREARKPVRTDLREHSKAQSSAQGRWPPLADSTKERRRRGGRRRGRKLLGRLPSATKITSGVDFVRAVSIPRWARAHHVGARVGHGSKLPARVWMFVSRKLRREVLKLYGSALWRAWRGR